MWPQTRCRNTNDAPAGALQEQLGAAPLVGRDAGVVDGVVKPQPEFHGIAIVEQRRHLVDQAQAILDVAEVVDNAGRARCTGGKARHRPWRHPATAAKPRDGATDPRTGVRPTSTAVIVLRIHARLRRSEAREHRAGDHAGAPPREGSCASRNCCFSASTSRNAAARRALPALTRPLRSRITCSAQPGLSVSSRRKTSPAMRSARTSAFARTVVAARRVRDDAHLADQRVGARARR